MSEKITFTISTLALIISLFNLWLAFFNHGKVLMTLPSIIVFGYDHGSRNHLDPKIMVRCHIFSTGGQGQVIEALWIKLHCQAKDEIFPVWGVNADNKLVRGGGMWVGKTGVTAWHYFNASTDFKFLPESYTLEVFARIHGYHHPQKLWSTMLSIPLESNISQHDSSEQIWFELEPQTGKFQCRLEPSVIPESR